MNILIEKKRRGTFFLLVAKIMTCNVNTELHYRILLCVAGRIVPEGSDASKALEI
jgi:hypothetical protein